MAEDVVYVPEPELTVDDNNDVDVFSEEDVMLLPANPARKSALIVNTGEYPARVTTDGQNPTVTRGKPLAPGEALSLTSPFCPKFEIRAICTVAGQATSINPSEVY